MIQAHEVLYEQAFSTCTGRRYVCRVCGAGGQMTDHDAPRAIEMTWRKEGTLTFVDLRRVCALAVSRSDLTAGRLQFLLSHLPRCGLVEICGLPLYVGETNEFYWVDERLTPKRIRSTILEGLGASAVLTYLNPQNKTLEQLGELCVQRKHLWAYRWISVGIVFSGVSLATELALARDTRFFCSWPVALDTLTDSQRLFVARGSLKDWCRFVEHCDDSSFHEDVRATMKDAAIILNEVLPGCLT